MPFLISWKPSSVSSDLKTYRPKKKLRKKQQKYILWEIKFVVISSLQPEIIRNTSEYIATMHAAYNWLHSSRVYTLLPWEDLRHEVSGDLNYVGVWLCSWTICLKTKESFAEEITSYFNQWIPTLDNREIFNLCQTTKHTGSHNAYYATECTTFKLQGTVKNQNTISSSRDKIEIATPVRFSSSHNNQHSQQKRVLSWSQCSQTRCVFTINTLYRYLRKKPCFSGTTKKFFYLILEEKRTPFEKAF